MSERINDKMFMNDKMFIIEFMNGKTKKFDDSRFRYEIEYGESPSMMVYSRVTKQLVLDIPTLANVAFIHRNVIKKPKYKTYTDESQEPEVEEPIDESTDD